MFNTKKIIRFILVNLLLLLTVDVFGDLRDQTLNTGINTAQELNEYRVRQSNLAFPPKLLHLNRHLFLLWGEVKQTAKVSNKGTLRAVSKVEPIVLKQKKDIPVKVETQLAPVKPLPHFSWNMMPPVKTPIAKHFGEGDAKLSRGVIYDVYTTQVVYAPIDGDVIFCGPMTGFGYVVMIEKDMENIVLVAGISNLNVKQGSRLCRGQKIGSVIKGEWVYLEFRHEGIPIDPQAVLISG